MGVRHPLVEFIEYLILLLLVSFSLNPVNLGLFVVFFVCLNRKNIILILVVTGLTTIVNPLVNHKGETYLFYLNNNIVTLEAIIYGVVLGLQCSCLILAFKRMSDKMTSDKVILVTSYLIPPLALIISMAIRSLSRYYRKMREVFAYQRANVDNFNWFHKIFAVINTFSIMIGWILENSIETSDSMVVRGYGTRRRITYHKMRILKIDVFEILMIGVIFVLFMITKPFIMIVPYIKIGINIINIIAVISFLMYEVVNEDVRIRYRLSDVWKNISTKRHS